MDPLFIWLSYLVTYGLIAGYAVTVWRRSKKISQELGTRARR